MKRIRNICAFFLILAMCFPSLTGCHGKREQAAFTVPKEFDTSRQYELTFWAKNDTNKTQTDIYKEEDVTKPFQKGAKEALALARLYGCRLAVLKEKSPSCGTAGIYDGTFTKTKIDGQGVCARLLEENGIETVGESRITEIPQILARLDKGEES